VKKTKGAKKEEEKKVKEEKKKVKEEKKKFPPLVRKTIVEGAPIKYKNNDKLEASGKIKYVKVVKGDREATIDKKQKRYHELVRWFKNTKTKRPDGKQTAYSLWKLRIRVHTTQTLIQYRITGKANADRPVRRLHWTTRMGRRGSPAIELTQRQSDAQGGYE
jgi:hypothetical protein